MDKTLAQKAISLALNADWNEAQRINLEILSNSPEDVEALNRLARCYSEIGDYSEACKVNQKVLKIDPQNTIAKKCFEKWSAGKKGSKQSANLASGESFLEEPGKTKIAPLMHLGDSNVFAGVNSGDEVTLLPHAHRVSVTTCDGKYLGRLHDDLAARLRKLVKAGNKYQVLIKSVNFPKEATVFIREIERGKLAKDMSSFPTEKIDYVSFTSPELVHKDKQIMEFQEDVVED